MATISDSSGRKSRITRASADEVPAIKSMAEAAYSKYIERLGKPPGPMMDDYHELLHTKEMYVLRSDDGVSGAVILTSDEKSVEVNNVVVRPTTQGRGYGRMLMKYAETIAEARGLRTVTLYTNVKMYENIEIYKRMGFVEIGRRNEDGYDRVFFEKNLS